MKKKIGIILAILLCVVLIFTFVACGDKGTTDGNGTTTEEGGNGSGGNGSGGNGSGGNNGGSSDKLPVTEETQAAKKAEIESYIPKSIPSLHSVAH